MRAAQGQHRCTCAVDPSLSNVECKVQNVELWTEKKTFLNAPLILHLPFYIYHFFCRVRNDFTVQDKIPRLTLGMTRMSFVFRDASTRSLRSLAQDDKGARGKAARPIKTLPFSANKTCSLFCKFFPLEKLAQRLILLQVFHCPMGLQKISALLQTFLPEKIAKRLILLQIFSLPGKSAG